MTLLAGVIGIDDSVLKMKTTEQANVITICAVNEHKYQ